MGNPYPIIQGQPSIVFVNQASTAGTEDGTSQAPYKSIQAAVDAAQPGDTIAVGTGTYDGGITLTKSVKLQGKRPQYERPWRKLDTPSGSEYPGRYAIVAREAGDIEIAGLTIEDPAAPEGERTSGIIIENSGSVNLHDLRLGWPERGWNPSLQQ
ncbi:MAG: DUF1565 domain-containing protein [Rhodopseudomonas palustris]|nr:DUF1565 domain-containing protein [Rhodopseudomonas palustris]